MKHLPVLLILVLLQQRGSAQLSAFPQKTLVVKRMIELNHLAPRPVDDRFSADFFKSLLNRTDERRLLFTEPEFRQLKNWELTLDEELNGVSWTFFEPFSALYKKALSRADSLLQKIAAKPFDFSQHESVTRGKRDSFLFAADPAALAARWNRYLKYTALDRLFDIRQADSTGKTSLKTVIARSEPGLRQQLLHSEIRRLKRIQQHPSGAEGYLQELFLESMAAVFDPHTGYFSPREKEAFREELSSEALSLGLQLDENSKGQVMVDKLVPGGPAWKSGDLNKGDLLLSIHREGKQALDLTGLSAGEAEEELDAVTNEKVILKIKKADGTEKSVLLQKEKMENEDNVVKGFVLQGEKKIGYILLPGFYTEWENETGSSCANDVAKEIVKLKKENIEGLILDVRYNGGGSVGEAMEMTGIFVDEGPLTGIQTREPKILYLRDPNRGTIYSGPLVLLINGQSASASEMLAAALQDYNRAVIVGSASFGKATMQQLLPADTLVKRVPAASIRGDMVKITTGKLYRLNGSSAQKTGVQPDVALPDAFDGIEYREQYLPHALSSEPVAKNNYYKPLAPLPLAELALKSRERLKTDPAFTEIQQVIRLMKARNAGLVSIPLRAEDFEKWALQKEQEMTSLEKPGLVPQQVFRVGNHSSDQSLLVNNTYAREQNRQWLEDLAEDIYIREAFLVLNDLITLRKQ